MGYRFWKYLISLSIAGCTSTNTQTFSQLITEPAYPSKTYDTPKDITWKAITRVLEVYTLTAANKEKGILVTEWENQKSNPDLFGYSKIIENHKSLDRLPATIRGNFGENSSRLKVYLTPVDNDPQKTKVEIEKKLLTYNPINGTLRNTASDQLEEAAIFENISWVLKSHVLKTCNGRESFYLPNEECPIEKKVGDE
jgi:hypothetical protein